MWLAAMGDDVISDPGIVTLAADPIVFEDRCRRTKAFEALHAAPGAIGARKE